MKLVELYGRVRYVVRIERISRREAARRFGIDPRTVAKMLTFSVPPGYRRNGPPARPKLHAIGFDAVKHLVLCRIERRPARLDMTVYPYLPRARLAVTSARSYLDLLTEAMS